MPKAGWKASIALEPLRVAALAGVLVVFVSLGGKPPSAHEGAGDPGAFVQRLGDEVVGILRQGDEASSDRRDRFRALFGSNFDVPAIGRFVLGRHWRIASEEQRSEYLALFREYVVDIYARQFSTYSGETFLVNRQRRLDEADTLVSTEIRHPTKAPIHVDFRVRAGDEGFTIVDVIVERVSLIVTKRSEFQSILEREGMQGLLSRLRAYVDG
jgi:phospholipid transport system substrate-binding protein